MIDDIARKLSYVDKLLFADDTTLYKVGHQTNLILADLQPTLDDVALRWCDACMGLSSFIFQIDCSPIQVGDVRRQRLNGYS